MKVQLLTNVFGHQALQTQETVYLVYKVWQCGDSDTIDVAFGTAVNITDAGIGTVEDQQVSAVSSCSYNCRISCSRSTNLLSNI